MLLADALGTDRLHVSLEPERVVTAPQRTEFERLLDLRAERRPLAHVRGHCEFWSLDFTVTPDVLTPRPESERLVEEAARFLRDLPAPVAVDVGTGSGCLAVALAVEVPAIHVHAVDVSSRALVVAAGNARRHGVYERVTFHRGDLLAPLLDELSGGADAVLSNPPYVRRAEAGEVDLEVLWEPAVAVFCEGDPARLYERLARDAATVTRPGGLLLLELTGRGSEPVVAAVAALEQWEDVTVLPDLAGLPRVLRATRGRSGGG